MFSFDNETITGWTYFIRVVLSHFITFILLALFLSIFLLSADDWMSLSIPLLLGLLLVCFWLLAATCYKRTGAFGWSKKIRILCSMLVFVSMVAFIGLFVQDLRGREKTINETLILAFFYLSVIIIAQVMHFVLWFKDGNKTHK